MSKESLEALANAVIAEHTEQKKLEAKALEIVTEVANKLGLYEVKIAKHITTEDDEPSTYSSRLFYCSFLKKRSKFPIFELPIAILSNEGILRFLILNNKGILEVIDLKKKSHCQEAWLEVGTN